MNELHNYIREHWYNWLSTRGSGLHYRSISAYMLIRDPAYYYRYKAHTLHSIKAFDIILFMRSMPKTEGKNDFDVMQRDLPTLSLDKIQ